MGVNSGMSTRNRILVIEDHPETQDSITLWLELAGYVVLVARDGLEGLGVLSREQPDLIITDIVMPGLNGIEMIGAVRQSMSPSNRVPILVLTGHYKDFGTKAIAAGADRALQKPIDPNILMTHVRHLLNPPAAGLTRPPATERHQP